MNKSRFHLPGNRSTKLSRKILLPILLVFSLALTVFFIFNYLTNATDNKVAENENSRQAEQFYNLKMQDQNNFALGLAIQAANNPEIQAAFAEQDRQRLTDLTTESFSALKKQYNISQYQYNLSPAIAFLRLHRLTEFGDDISASRAAVVQVNSTKQPVSGLEVGKNGIGIRGIEPVFYQGKFIGSVEVGTNADLTLVNSLKEEYGGDWRIMLTREELSNVQATPEFISKLEEGPTPDLLVLASTIESIYSEPETYAKAIGGERLITRVQGDQFKNYSITSLPLRDYSGKIIGVVDIIIDQTDLIRAQTNRLIAIISVTLLSLAIGSYSVATITNRLLRPLTALTNATQAIEKGDLTQKVNVASQDEIGQLGNAFNSMTAQLRDLFGTLEQRVADRTQALANVAEISTIASSIPDLQKMLETVVHLTQRRFGLYHAHIFTYDEDTQVLQIVACGYKEGDEHEGTHGTATIPMEQEQSLVARAARTRQPVIVNDVRSDPGWLPNPLLPDTASELAVPLLVGDKLIGVMDVQSERANAFTESDADIQMTLGSQVAVATQNIQSTEIVAKRAKELQTVAAISTTAATISDIQKMLESVVHLTQRGFGLYHAHVFTYNENTAELQIVACGYKEGDEHEGTHGTAIIPLEQEQSLVARAARTRQAVIVNDVRSDPGWLPNPLLPDTASEMAVPMIVGDQILGVLDVQSDRMNAFTEEDASIQTTLASQVATALQNASSYAQAKHQAERETTLNIINQKIQSAPTIEAALQTAARELGHALGMRQTLVALDPEALPGSARMADTGQQNLPKETETTETGVSK